MNDRRKVLLYDQISASCFSKHDLIFLSYDFDINEPERIFTYRDFRNIDYTALGENISQIDWNSMYNLALVDEQLDFLEGNIVKLFDIAVPIKTRILTSKSRPWFNANIKSLIKLRDLAHARWKRFRSNDLKEEFKTARSNVNYAIRRAKIEYYASRFSGSINARQTWNTIREIGIGRSVDNSSMVTDADELNQLFVNIPMATSDASFYEGNERNISSNAFEFFCVSQDNVLTSFSAVRSNATGCDNINPKFVKIILPYLLPFITHFFNTIIMSSCYPKKWRHSKIIPFPESGAEYRPIAILPYLSKVLEKLLYLQMSTFLYDSGLMVENQSGFRPKHSCVTTLIDVAEDLRRDLDDKNVSVLVLLDHSKAFDTIDHDILALKLSRFFNFSNTSIRLMQSYLNGRSQSVYTKNSVSKPLFLNRGVPQGSILGPLLFTMYINDLPLHLSYCKSHMYADDVQLHRSSTIDQLEDTICRVNADLQSIYVWASANGLSLNPEKSKCLLVQRKSTKCPTDVEIMINGQKIQIVSSVKNLGIIFNNTLTWNNHINSIVGTVYNKLRTLWATQSFTPLNIRVLLAKTYVMPSLLYGCEVFSNCDSVSRRKLNIVFNNICRYVYGVRKYDRISHLSIQLYGISIDNHFKLKALVFLHKIIYLRQPPYLFRRLSFARSNRGTKLILFRHRTLTSERQFFINVLPLWNTLPHSIQTTSNVIHFKVLLINYFARNI